MNFTITINGQGPELSAALKALKAATEGQAIVSGEVTAHVVPATPTAPSAPVSPPPAAVPTQAPPQQMAATSVPTYPAPPAQPAAAPPPQQPTPTPTVPTTEQTYSLEQLGVAATQLMDAGRQADLLNLLQAFGVQALTALPKEQYGNFATQLRALGARI